MKSPDAKRPPNADAEPAATNDARDETAGGVQAEDAAPESASTLRRKREVMRLRKERQLLRQERDALRGERQERAQVRRAKALAAVPAAKVGNREPTEPPARPEVPPVPAKPSSPEPKLVAAPEAAVSISVGSQEAGGLARQLRRRRSQRLAIRLLAFVLLPTLLAAAYYFRFASRQYESVALITIYSAEVLPTTTTGLSALVGLGAGSSPVMDGLSVREYVFSRDILRRLDEDEGFVGHYRDSSKDWWSRLPSDATFEDAFEDYQDRVFVEVDPNSGVAKLRVLAYSPEAAQRFAKAIIRYSEEMVNNLAERARTDQVKFAEAEVRKAEERLSLARQGLVRVQQERGEYNPELSAQAQLSIRTNLEGELARARAELAQVSAVMTPDSPQVVGVREKIRSLAAQVGAATQKMVSKGEGESLNKSAADFEAALVEKEFATLAYQSVMTTLETARAQAARQHRYLATIAPPSQADESTYPNRWLSVLTVFLGSFLFMGIGSLILATIKEHAQL